MNFADSDELGRHFRARGFEPTDLEAEADIIMVNTCTVRDLAEHKAMSFIGRLKEWKDQKPQGVVVVTGCAAERAKADIRRKFPYVDLIVGAKDIEAFPAELDGLLKELDISEERLIPSELTPPLTTGVVQYVTVMRGCNYNCSYCIVPSVRGREVYRPIQEIMRDTADRIKEGAKEIWLLGQTVNSYKPAEAPFSGYDFADLLRDVANVPGLERLRFISPHPYYLTPKLARAMAEIPQVCEHIHLPVQSGSNEMLRRMKRNYTVESYLKEMEDLRTAVPDIAISTDLIVGFPGETIDDFKKTMDLVEKARFDSAYCFKYSPRPGTLSAEWPETMSEAEKEKRVNELLALTDTQGTEKAKALIGSTQEVLIEQDKGNGVVRGKTRGAWRVRIKEGALALGQIVNARIKGTHSRELHGELL